MKLVMISAALILLSACQMVSSKSDSHGGVRSSSSAQSTSGGNSKACGKFGMVTIELRESVFVPAYDNDGKSKGDVGTAVIFGKLSPQGKRKIQCTFYNENGKDMSFKKGSRFHTIVHYRKWGPHFHDAKAGIEVRCSEERLDPTTESIDWNGDELGVLNKALPKKLHFQEAPCT